MTELCAELHNWFDRGQPKFKGAFEISNGKLTNEEFLATIQLNQYFRIIGSVFNDGVFKNTESLSLTDEKFDGTIWLMSVPKAVVDLSDEIDEWLEKYEDVSTSPFQSESFGGYAYSKASSATADGARVGALSWQSIFANRLNRWRKV